MDVKVLESSVTSGAMPQVRLRVEFMPRDEREHEAMKAIIDGPHDVFTVIEGHAERRGAVISFIGKEPEPVVAPVSEGEDGDSSAAAAGE